MAYFSFSILRSTGFWVLALFILVGCRAKFDVVRSPASIQADQEQPEEKHAVKLHRDDCVDPDLSKLQTGETLMLCDGTMAEGTFDASQGMDLCGTDGQMDCISNSSFFVVDKEKLKPENIKRGIALGGITGAFPSTEHPLPRYTSRSTTNEAGDGGITTDLTSFASQLSSDGSFEFWDKYGKRYTGSGDSDLISSNIRDGVEIENLGIQGSYAGGAGTYPAAAEVAVGVDFGPSGNDYTGTKRPMLVCKNGKGITNSGGDTTTPWDDGDANGNDSIDDYQNNEDPWYEGAERSNCNEDNFTDVTDTDPPLVPEDGRASSNGATLTWNKIFRDDLTGMYFTNALSGQDLTWTEALNLCASLDGGDAGDGWYLPTQKELMQLSINGISKLANFGNTAQNFWSSSTVSSNTGNAWFVYLAYGFTNFNYEAGTRAGFCVRS